MTVAGTLADFIAQAASGWEPNAPLSFSPTLNPWAGYSAAPPTAPGVTLLGKTTPTGHFVLGDDHADTTARDRGVNPIGSGWEALAKSQLGSPYIWADANPIGPAGGAGTGFDCSGFTQWVYKRAFGVTLPHLSSAQQSQLPSVTAKALQPGDLVFFRYSARNGPGNAADHVGIYAGNGKMYAASSSQGQIVLQDVDWSAFVGGGSAPGHVSQLQGPTVASQGTTVTRPQKGAPSTDALMLAPMYVTPGNMPSTMANVTALLMAPPAKTPKPSTKPGTTPPAAGDDSVKAQLYAGFIKAGRPDLAKLVYSKDFQTWIGAESGWNVDSVSKYYAGHGQNYGLFQFWEGHPWTSKYLSGSGDWTASAYEQAVLVARYFPSLSPEDIHRYASEVRTGDYHGWP